MFVAMPVIGGLVFFKHSSLVTRLVTVGFGAVFMYESSRYLLTYVKKRTMINFIRQLKRFTNTTKQCVQLVKEYIITLNYYTDLGEAQFFKMVQRFTEIVYKVLVSSTSVMRYFCVNVLENVPLTVGCHVPEEITAVNDIDIDTVKVSILRLCFCIYRT